MPVHSDMQEITALIYTYPERLDAGDIDGMGRLFANGVLRGEDPASVHRGYAEVVEMYRTILHLYDGKPSTKHITTNLVVEVDESRATASARSYCIVLQARPELPLQIIFAGRYYDQFARTDGAWHFTERLCITDYLGDLRFHMKEPFLSELLNRGVREGAPFAALMGSR